MIRIHDQILALGFEPTAAAESYRRNGTTLRLHHGWWTLSRDGVREPQLGRPGLWRYVEDAWAFELPLLESAAPPAAIVAWADATGEGAVPDGWEPPAQGEIATWLDGGLTAGAGALVRQGALILEPIRLALRYRELVRVDECLPQSRRRWLESLLSDAQAKWRMVRLDLEEAGVHAEVDLTGVPQEYAEPLVRAAHAALAWVVAWLLPPLVLIADPGAKCRALDPSPTRANTKSKERKTEHVQ